MDDLIDRKNVLHEIDQLSHAWEYGNAVDDCYEIVKKAPTIEAEPVRHGHWVVHTDKWASGDEYFGYAECSECGDMFYAVETIGIKPIWDYCPNCGAKMDAQEKEDDRKTD